MKRIDILKGIEQILVQKAYETGHISHRADGDWQKQADGSWIPYKGQSNQPTPDTDNSAERAEYERQLIEEQNRRAEEDPTGYGYEEPPSSGEITEEDLKELDKKDLSQHLSNMHNQTIQSLLNDLGNGEITEDQFKSQMSDLNSNITTSLNSLNGNKEDSNDWEEEDTEGYYGNSGGLRSTIYEGAYDTQISNIGNTEEDDYGNSISNDEAVENVVRGIMQEWTGDTDDEDAVEAVHDGLKDAVLDRWSTIYVQKSAVRDMQSTPTTKNMGF